MLARGSISVTCTSRALKMLAYSTPTTPAPITARLLGMNLRSMTSSLSSTRSPSNGT